MWHFITWKNIWYDIRCQNFLLYVAAFTNSNSNISSMKYIDVEMYEIGFDSV